MPAHSPPLPFPPSHTHANTHPYIELPRADTFVPCGVSKSAKLPCLPISPIPSLQECYVLKFKHFYLNSFLLKKLFLCVKLYRLLCLSPLRRSCRCRNNPVAHLQPVVPRIGFTNYLFNDLIPSLLSLSLFRPAADTHIAIAPVSHALAHRRLFSLSVSVGLLGIAERLSPMVFRERDLTSTRTETRRTWIRSLD